MMSLLDLPPELLHNILSYLFPYHIPPHVSFDLYVPYRKRPDPLVSLLKTNKLLYATVQTWARHLLQSHQAILHHTIMGKCKKEGASDSNLNRLAHWSRSFCVFCGRKSSRRAELMNGLTCCVRCDTHEWKGKKISRTEAKKVYALREGQLMGGEARDTAAAGEADRPAVITLDFAYDRFCDIEEARRLEKEDKEWLERGEGDVERWGRVRCGISYKGGMAGVVLAIEDVERRAAEVHGEGWRDMLEAREQKKLERRAVREKRHAASVRDMQRAFYGVGGPGEGLRDMSEFQNYDE